MSAAKELSLAASGPSIAGSRRHREAWVAFIAGATLIFANLARGSEDMIYWTDWSSRVVCRRGLTEDVGRVFARVNVPDAVNKGESLHPGPIAVDTLEGKVYWICSSSFLRSARVASEAKALPTQDQGVIQRANLDGSGLETIVVGLIRPFDLAVDPKGRRLYWGEDGDHAISARARIRRANLDGTAIETLPIPLFYFPPRCTVGLSDQMLYHIMQTMLFRTSLDGTRREYPIVCENMGQNPHQTGIVVDDTMQKVYWNWGTDIIYRANTDGTSIEEIGHDRITDLTLDQKNRKLYWVAWTQRDDIRRPIPFPHQYLRRANLDGSCIEELPLSYEVYPKVVVPHRSWIGGIALYTTPATSQTLVAQVPFNARKLRVVGIVSFALLSLAAGLFVCMRCMSRRRKSGRLRRISCIRYAALSSCIPLFALWLATAIPWEASHGYEFYYGRERYVFKTCVGRLIFRDTGAGPLSPWPNGLGVARASFEELTWRDQIGLWMPGLNTGPTGFVLIVPIWSLLASFALLSVIFYWFDRPPKRNHCPWCNYNLTGNTSGRCSECGRPVTGILQPSNARFENGAK